jgi:hypothetical protein
MAGHRAVEQLELFGDPVPGQVEEVPLSPQSVASAEAFRGPKREPAAVVVPGSRITLKDGARISIASEPAPAAFSPLARMAHGEPVALVATNEQSEEVGRLVYMPGGGPIDVAVREQDRRRGIGSALYDAHEAAGGKLLDESTGVIISDAARAVRQARKSLAAAERAGAPPNNDAAAASGRDAALGLFELEEAGSPCDADLAVGGIADAGEELMANRRNRGKAALRWEDVADLDDALKVKEVVKSNVWPRPDYPQLIASGMPPLIAHVVKQVYDSLAAQPAIAAGRIVGHGPMQAYIAGVRRVEAAVMAWTQDRQAVELWARRTGRIAGAMLGSSLAIAELKAEGSLLALAYPDGWRNHRDELKLIGGNRVLGALQPGYEEARRAIKAIDAGWPASREAWAVRGFKILERPSARVAPGFNGAHGLYVANYYVDTFASEDEAAAARDRMGPFVLVGKRGYVGAFDSREQAAQEAAQRARGAARASRSVGEKGSKVVNAERLGPARRLPGEDVTAERLVQEFGFRGVNFGNWLKTPAARAEAQLHLNHAFDAFHDLSEALDVPPRALSLGGMLGLAIGAQGHGGPNAAHFVPGWNELNLTREAGAGAVAHEWGHGFDHYFARMAGLGTAEAPFLSEHAELGPVLERVQVVDRKLVRHRTARFGEVRPEVVEAFQKVVQAMTKRQQTPAEAAAAAEAAQERLRKNVNGWLATIRRDFGAAEPEFDAIASRIRAGEAGTGRIAASTSTSLSPAVVEIRELYKAAHGRLYPLDPLKGLQSNLDALSFRSEAAAAVDRPVERLVSTKFSQDAAALDRDKGGKPYWSTRREMFARAFDAFVADRLEQKARKNTYLTFGVRQTETVPVGEERQAVNAAFETLFDELQVRETQLHPALFSVAKAEGPALPSGQLHQELERLRRRWPRMPEVHVVDSVGDLPFAAPPLADGAHYDGKIFLVAGNISSLRQLQTVVAHEMVMHHSLEEMLGAYGFGKLHHGIQSLKDRGDPTICRLAGEVAGLYGPLPPDEETKEIVARAGEECLDERGDLKVAFGFMKGVFSGICCWLRDHGVAVPFTHLELQGILHSSGQWAKSAGREAPVVATERAHQGSLGLAIDSGRVAEGAKPRIGTAVVREAVDVARQLRPGDVAKSTYAAPRGYSAGRVPAKELGR